MVILVLKTSKKWLKIICVKIICTDNGGKFTSTEFKDYLKKEDELTIPKCPKQTGVAKRFKRTVVEMV